MTHTFSIRAMRVTACLTLLVVAGAYGQTAVKGKAVFKGTAPKLKAIGMDADAVCASKHPAPVFPETVAIKADGSLKNVFVYVKTGLEGKSFPVPAAPVVLDQDSCLYKPHVFGIMPNQTLKIVNSDPTTHNVHALAEVNEEFNVGQHQGQPPVLRKFAKPEATVTIVCNQHPWMRAVAHVVTNPFYAVTDADGNYELKGLPPGKYTIAAVHERFGASEAQVTVAAGKPAAADFTFGAGQAYRPSALRAVPALVLP